MSNKYYLLTYLITYFIRVIMHLSWKRLGHGLGWHTVMVSDGTLSFNFTG